MRYHGATDEWKSRLCCSCQYTHYVCARPVFLGRTTHYRVSWLLFESSKCQLGSHHIEDHNINKSNRDISEQLASIQRAYKSTETHFIITLEDSKGQTVTNLLHVYIVVQLTCLANNYLIELCGATGLQLYVTLFIACLNCCNLVKKALNVASLYEEYTSTPTTKN